MTLDELQGALDADRDWRNREIRALSSLLSSQNNDNEQRALLRASISILYAHWEGFVKFASNRYLELASTDRRTFRQMKENFIWIMSRRRITPFFGGVRKPQEHVNIVMDVIKFYDTHDADKFRKAIDTKSNLNSDVFKEICYIIGLPFRDDAYDCDFIDRKLLDKRNHVAHGESTLLEIDDFEEFRNNVLKMIDEFCYDVSLLAANSSWRAA